MNPDVLKENIKLFEEELELLGENMVLIALGTAIYNFLNKCLGHKYKICKITHYSHQIGKEKYREEVLGVLENL